MEYHEDFEFKPKFRAAVPTVKFSKPDAGWGNRQWASTNDEDWERTQEKWAIQESVKFGGGFGDGTAKSSKTHSMASSLPLGRGSSMALKTTGKKASPPKAKKISRRKPPSSRKSTKKDKKARKEKKKRR